MKNVHVHVHGALETRASLVRQRAADEISYRRDKEGKFSTSSGTGEQHAATAELHASLAARKGTDHEHTPHHLAAAEAHKKAASFLSQANKAQHPGSAVEAERHAKEARGHEYKINKGHGGQEEINRQNKAMSNNGKAQRELAAELDAKYPDKKKTAAKKTASKTKDAAIVTAFVGDDWDEWNARHKGGLRPGTKVRNQTIEGHGTVHSITGNMVTVRHSKKVGGKKYNRLDDFHASKLHPHTAEKTKDSAPCGCGGHTETQDAAEIVRSFVGDDWAKWNAEHPEYAHARKDAGTKGQAALDKPSHKAHMAAHKAHLAAARHGSNIKFPGDNDYVSHHIERAKTHLEEAKKHKK